MSELIGVHRLGYKDSSAYQDLVLGDEYQALDGELDATQQYILPQSERRVHVKYVRNTGANALVPGHACKRDVANDVAHDVTEASAGDVCCGIVDPRLNGSVATGEKFLMIVRGPIDAVVGGAVVKGATATVGALGKSVSGANTSVHAYGVYLEDAAADGDVARVDVDFRTLGV